MLYARARARARAALKRTPTVRELTTTMMTMTTTATTTTTTTTTTMIKNNVATNTTASTLNFRQREKPERSIEVSPSEVPDALLGRTLSKWRERTIDRSQIENFL
ncbi:hypothetical protein HZH68_010696 [Vespula germanica]|uniref:Uncharacterized protein n=1 Tax=Vespula germanica TaxID=30212 RepID=A0A834JT52_VESGE|nr:hypothetical protein HZH68_010696 [Vespula germanica]